MQTMLRRVGLAPAILIWTTAVVMLLLSGCAPPSASALPPNPGAKTTDTTLAPELLIKIGVIVDHTGSAAKNSSPAVLPQHLHRLVELVLERGGSIGLAPVRERVEGGLIRLAIDPPAPKPAMPGLHVPLIEQQARLRRYNAALNAWKTAENQRRESAAISIRVFEDQARGILLAQRTDKLSNVNDVLIRIDRFLNERIALAGYVVDPWVLTASDLNHNASRARYEMTARPRVAWLTRTVKVPPIFIAPELYENTEPALDWIISQAGRR